MTGPAIQKVKIPITYYMAEISPNSWLLYANTQLGFVEGRDLTVK